MWICLNNGFLSAVKDHFNPDSVLVRARVRKHLEDNFPNDVIFQIPNSDYAWRVRLKKTQWAEFLYEKSLSIEYTNFKNSVKDYDLKDMYSEIWWLGMQLQIKNDPRGHDLDDVL